MAPDIADRGVAPGIARRAAAPGGPGRRTVLAVVAALVLLVAVGRPAGATTYVWPVDAPIVAPFAPPDQPWGRGHRGVDLAVAAGTPVGAMGRGTVTFAGSVAASRWVTVGHADGIRTTVGPLATIAVAAGDAVASGTVVGTAAGDAHGAGSARLHVSARRGAVYVDPAALVTSRVPTLVGVGGTAVATPHAGAGTGPVLVPGTSPSGNHLIVLAGLATATGDVPIDVARYGFDQATASPFSYAGIDRDGRPRDYAAPDTWQSVHDAAVALRDQLRARWRAAPGEAVDLVGHSLGGLVAAYYLLVLHDPTDPTLPPIGRVATIASPLRGADLAAEVVELRRDPIAGALVALIDRAVPALSAEAAVVADVQPGSAVTEAVARAWRRARADPAAGPLATGTDVLTIGALLDPVVPPHRAGLTGSDHHTVIDTHGGAPRDPRTDALLTAFLHGRPLPVRDPGQRIVDLLAVPVGLDIGTAERFLGGLLTAPA